MVTLMHASKIGRSCLVMLPISSRLSVVYNVITLCTPLQKYSQHSVHWYSRPLKETSDNVVRFIEQFEALIVAFG